jgi:formylglycine-generating enzyme required for sulfatase activity
MLHPLEAALAQDPGDLLGWLALADHLEESGQTEKAQATRAFRSALAGVDVEENTATLDALMRAGHYPHNVLLTNSVGMTLALVPAGTFLMGSPQSEEDRREDETQHAVEISRPFYLGIHPVTQAQYKKVMGKNPSHFNKRRGGGPDHPVECVSWEDAVAFCEKLSALEKERSSGRAYVLPGEAEWEYSCREGGLKGGPFHFGDSLTSELANFLGDYPYGTDTKGPYLQDTTKVGTYPPNALGLYDLHGNVWEWCADWYGDYPKSPAKDPTGPTTGTARVLRGGCWDDYGHLCRAAYRDRFVPGFRSVRIGFRVVLRPPPRVPQEIGPAKESAALHPGLY